MIIFKYVVLIAKCSGECVYLKRDGDRGWFWKGEDCLDSNKAYQAYPLCQMTPKQPVESTTQEPLETTRETTSGVTIETTGENKTEIASDEDEDLFSDLTDFLTAFFTDFTTEFPTDFVTFFTTEPEPETLMSLALLQLPAVALAFLGIAKAFHKHGCTCQGLLHVFKASLLVFIPFFALGLIGLGYCLGLIPWSHIIQKIHRVQKQ